MYNGKHSKGFSKVLKKNKQEAARLMLEARAKRSPEEQLKLLDKRLGQGKGAHKERSRLEKQIREAKKNA